MRARADTVLVKKQRIPSFTVDTELFDDEIWIEQADAMIILLDEWNAERLDQIIQNWLQQKRLQKFVEG